MQGFVEGKIIYLREVRETDVNERYYTWLNDTQVNQYLETRYYPSSISSIKDYVNRLAGSKSEVFLAICYKSNDLHIGNIKLGPINWIHRYADISLLIGDKDYWGKGIATDAIKTITNYAFNTLNLWKVKAGCYADNIGSAKAFEKVGFTLEGRLKKHWFVEGKYQDHLSLGLCREDFAY